MKFHVIIAAIVGLTGLGFSSSSCAGNQSSDAEESQLAQSSSKTILDAIAVAESEAGGDAFEASIDTDRANPAYEVDVAADGKVFEVHVDLETGDVVDSREDTDEAAPAQLVSLVEIIRTAQEHREGRAYEASCDDDGGQLRCEVEVVTASGQVYEIDIDPQSGDVISSTSDQD